jgi:hypothetical protein
VSRDFFSSFMPAGFEPKDVFSSGTVDQGGNVANAIKALDIPVLLCAAHRLNTSVSWGLGISGTVSTPSSAAKGRAPTCKNPTMRTALSRCAALVGVFSHAAGNNDLLHILQCDELRDIQSGLEEVASAAVTLDAFFINSTAAIDTQAQPAEPAGAAPGSASVGAGTVGEAAAAGVGEGTEGGAAAAPAATDPPDVLARQRALQLQSRNDTRWLGNFNMLDRLALLERPVTRFFHLPSVRG